MILLTPQVLSNERTNGIVRNVQEVTREQLDRSRIKDEIKRDPLQRQILDPLFPGAGGKSTGSESSPAEKVKAGALQK